MQNLGVKALKAPINARLLSASICLFSLGSETLSADTIMYCAMNGFTDIDEKGATDYNLERFTVSLPSDKTGSVVIKGLSFLGNGSFESPVEIHLSAEWMVFGTVEAGGTFFKNQFTFHSHNLGDGVTAFRANCEKF